MHKKRIKIVAGLIIALLSILVVRLGYLQLVEGSKYSGISDKRRIRRTALEAVRGKIFDRNGVLLATNRPSFNISAKYNSLLYYYLRHRNHLFPRLEGIKAHKDLTESCVTCHNEQENLFKRLLNIIDINQKGLFEIAERTVKRVERIKKGVNKRLGKEVLIVEEVNLHPVVQDVPFKTIAKIESNIKEFPGIFIEIKPQRRYPNQISASHLIGYIDEIKKEEWETYRFKWNCKDNWPFIFDIKDGKFSKDQIELFCDEIENKKENTNRLFSLGYSGDILVGKTGIEAYYNMALLGNPGERFEEITYENAKRNKMIIERPTKTGENIFLTIDSNIQLLAEKALGNRRSAVVVMDPWNGEIIAMASNPRFNPNTFNEDFNKIMKDKRKPLLNRPVQSTLPPGSTFKIVTAVAALAEQVISENKLFKCNGRAAATRNKFRCFSKYGHGPINVEKALQYSCNEFFFNTAKTLGGNLLHKWSRRFGFGQHCGIDVPYERKGLFPKPKSVSETMNMSIGQGDVLASPLQVTKMIAMIANGGKDVKPHILKSIREYSGKVVMDTDIGTNRTEIPKGVVTIVKRGLVKVVTNGTARKMGIEKYGVAGKTGTSETRKQNENHAWFTGFAPHNNPEYCFTVLVEYTPMHGSEATAPILQKVLAGLFPERSEVN